MKLRLFFTLCVGCGALLFVVFCSSYIQDRSLLTIRLNDNQLLCKAHIASTPSEREVALRSEPRSVNHCNLFLFRKSSQREKLNFSTLEGVQILPLSSTGVVTHSNDSSALIVLILHAEAQLPKQSDVVHFDGPIPRAI